MSTQDTEAPITGPQDEVIAFLSDPRTHGPGVSEVGRIDTHAAIVFLAGDEVYKIKRAVTFPFLDYGRLEQRQAACAREVEINRLTAPDLYLGAVAVTREDDGSLALGGSGAPVEWAVHMRRFDEKATLDLLAADGRLDTGLVDGLAERVAELHDRAPAVTRHQPADFVAWVARENCTEMRDYPHLFPDDAVSDLLARTDAALETHRDLIEARAKAGFLRRCHGDLHLGNVALIDGKPVIFDAIEFSEDIATIDVLYDLAFLLMDLWERGMRTHANRVLNRWLVARRTVEDLDGLALLPLFMSMRAAIRAKVAGPRSSHQSGDEKARTEAEARRMFAAARRFLDPDPARLVAIGGLSGTGKTTVAMGIAAAIGPAPGAVVVRSDVMRKILADVAETERLPAESYTAAASATVYAEIDRWAGRALAARHAAILDAVHSKPEERTAACALARSAGVRFDGIWLEAPEETLIARVSGRTGDASDANAAVVRKQLAYDTGTVGWATVETGDGSQAAITKTLQTLGIETVTPSTDPDTGA